MTTLDVDDCFQDIGCGIGGPARHIASLSEANVIGLNINDYQLSRARILTEKAKLDHLCTFVKVGIAKEFLAAIFMEAFSFQCSDTVDCATGRASCL